MIRSGNSYTGYIIYMYVVYSYVHKCNLFFLSACLPLGIKFVSLARPYWGCRIYNCRPRSCLTATIAGSHRYRKSSLSTYQTPDRSNHH
ncbi:hypothetical protein VNO80_20361 [Phaseolus coccineus]|uniref:Uncharacterized protein n=1 Tax=Phaseolus coccineus TaxID=3886 RepID=A0AAN9MJ43_PHACN